MAQAFKEASSGTEKVNFERFKSFITKHNLLEGFQMTDVLFQKLFSELDAHKKTYLTPADW